MTAYDSYECRYCGRHQRCRSGNEDRLLRQHLDRCSSFNARLSDAIQDSEDWRAVRHDDLDRSARLSRPETSIIETVRSVLPDAAPGRMLVNLHGKTSMAKVGIVSESARLVIVMSPVKPFRCNDRQWFAIIDTAVARARAALGNGFSVLAVQTERTQRLSAFDRGLLSERGYAEMKVDSLDPFSRLRLSDALHEYAAGVQSALF